MAKRRKIPNTPIQANIHALSHDGRGIASIEGKTHFILGALPGETVEAKLLRCSSKFNEAYTTKVLEASPDRIEPHCPHFLNCGGCKLQHMSPAQQMQTKLEAFKELMLHLGEATPETWAESLTSEPWHYRRKARLSVRYVFKKERVLVGFRELNGRYVADNHECPILIKPISGLIDALSDLIGSLSVKDSIAQIELAAGDDKTALIFRHLAPLTEQDTSALSAFGETHKLLILLQPKSYDTIHAIGETAEKKNYLSYTLADENLRFEFTPEQFVQVNAEMNQKMLVQAMEWLALEPTDSVLDLFCGIGNFSLPLAKRVQKVVGVEGEKSAVDQAHKNAKLNDISNVSFYTNNLFESFAEADWAKESFDKLLLDPPRAGCAHIVENIKLINPSTILYISCHPATLARDTNTLLKAGYRLVKAGIMDMFPHTQHVEGMALFKK